MRLIRCLLIVALVATSVALSSSRVDATPEMWLTPWAWTKTDPVYDQVNRGGSGDFTSITVQNGYALKLSFSTRRAFDPEYSGVSFLLAFEGTPPGADLEVVITGYGHGGYPAADVYLPGTWPDNPLCSYPIRSWDGRNLTVALSNHEGCVELGHAVRVRAFIGQGGDPWDVVPNSSWSPWIPSKINA